MDTGTILVAILGSSAFTAIVNAVIELIKNRSGAKNNTNKGIRFALLYCLQQYGDKLVSQGSADLQEYKQFEEMYNTYKALKGDGYADRIKKDVENLPRRKEN